MTIAHVRFAVIAVAGLAAGALTALALLPQARERLLPTGNVRISGEALVGGPFALVDHTGRRVTDADFRGRIMLVVFGSTSAPETSAPALQVLAAALDRLGSGADRFAPVLITVDPERDTPERLRGYLAGFSPRLVGLTGTPAEIAEVMRAYRVRGPRAGEEWASPAAIYVMGADGRFRSLLSYSDGADAVAARLAAITSR